MHTSARLNFLNFNKWPRYLIARHHWHVYATALGVLVLLLVARFVFLPFAAQGDASVAVSNGPIQTRVYPTNLAPVVGPATANFIAHLAATGAPASVLGSVIKPYLQGQGVMIGFGDDNVQAFEYADARTARAQAAGIFQKAPALQQEKNFFHLYLKDNLLVLYFGHNIDVLKATQELMGAPQ